MINCLQNSLVSIPSDKWRFDLSQDWKTLTLDFESFNTDKLANKILWAFGFHISATGYLEERFQYFTDVTNLKLTAEPTMVNNPGEIVLDSKEEVVKKKNKHTIKKIERLAKLCAPVKSSSSPYLLSPAILSSCQVPTLISRLGSPAVLLFYCLPIPIFCPGSFAVL